MTVFLEALGGKLAERWVALLVLPGLLLLATIGVGHTLGQAHWNDIGRLAAELNRLAAEPALRGTGTLVLVLAGLLLAALGIGFAVQGAGAGVERLWLAARPQRLVTWRARRWATARSAASAALLEAARAQQSDDPAVSTLAAEARHLHLVRERLGVTAPAHAFWVGDRLAVPAERAATAYALDLGAAWPRLWMLLPPEARTELETARTRLATAARLAAWAAGYLAVGLLWWPAAVAGLITAVVSWRQSRTAAAVLADLVESVVDVHGRQLAETLGLSTSGTLTPELGAKITALLRRDFNFSQHESSETSLIRQRPLEHFVEGNDL
ncbi:hypothetical protein QLQ12_36385 [Actinoplanes sp. NEAU-A12]|uniref:Vegetative cell wall protein gp1 n=1 Tax=Actinoplanes sandaracinus TaxID=3045177 RepID=A0ABT6WWI2_9ACTN|nr:hypothetical protein [Actinoplanes sandaracinus]MDI6104084.1 hypothetical protein [Actinoplanes sandaracinus]